MWMRRVEFSGVMTICFALEYFRMPLAIMGGRDVFFDIDLLLTFECCILAPPPYCFARMLFFTISLLLLLARMLIDEFFYVVLAISSPG